MDGWTDRQTDGWTDRQTDRQTDGWTDKALVHFAHGVFSPQICMYKQKPIETQMLAMLYI